MPPLPVLPASQRPSNALGEGLLQRLGILDLRIGNAAALHSHELHRLGWSIQELTLGDTIHPCLVPPCGGEAFGAFGLDLGKLSILLHPGGTLHNLPPLN